MRRGGLGEQTVRREALARDAHESLVAKERAIVQAHHGLEDRREVVQVHEPADEASFTSVAGAERARGVREPVRAGRIGQRRDLTARRERRPIRAADEKRAGNAAMQAAADARPSGCFFAGGRVYAKPITPEALVRKAREALGPKRNENDSPGQRWAVHGPQPSRTIRCCSVADDQRRTKGQTPRAVVKAERGVRGGSANSTCPLLARARANQSVRWLLTVLSDSSSPSILRLT
jgi:hypothetical protein